MISEHELRITSTIMNGSLDRLRKGAHRLNRIYPGYERSVWLIGDGRSGTTWVASCLNTDGYFREVFEPFHPEFVDDMQFLNGYFYERPEDHNPELLAATSAVFSGHLWNWRTDADNAARLYRGLLVKDILANLFAKWAKSHHPEIEILLLLRNPFAVALSKQKKQNWTWVLDPTTLLQQQKLREDFLDQYGDLIFRTRADGGFILNQILIWSIINYVPLTQFCSQDLKVLFYEEFLIDPSVATSLALDEEKIVPLSVASQPSKVTDAQSARSIADRISWKTEIEAAVIDKGQAILAEFGLEGLYDSDGYPQRPALKPFGFL